MATRVVPVHRCALDYPSAVASGLSFRDRFFTRPVARAITSPLGIVLAGAGTAAGILLSLGALAPVLGIGLWAVNVARAMPKTDRGPDIDPYALREPWRGYVLGCMNARARFRRTVDAMRAGPLRDRLTDVSHRFDTGVEESWRIAVRGHDVDGALRELGPNEVMAQLEYARRTPAGVARDSTIDALESQLASINRLSTTSQDTRGRLQVLEARLNELVARSVELSVTGASDVGGLDADVAAVVEEMEALRQAFEETQQSTGQGPISLPQPQPSAARRARQQPGA